MLTRPEFLILNDTPILISVTRDKGKIVNVAGPYQCVGTPGITPEQFIKELNNLMGSALHTGKPLQLKDLPKKIQKQIMEEPKKEETNEKTA